MHHHPRPPTTGLTTVLWRAIQPIMVPVQAVMRTQPSSGEDDATWIAGVSFSGDPYAHVVVVEGLWLLEDGHNRHQAALNAGEALFPARVFVWPGHKPADADHRQVARYQN